MAEERRRQPATSLLLAITILLTAGAHSVRTADQEGPRFQEEPPGLVEFTNAKEAVVPCQALGRPSPAVRWIKLPDGVAAAEVPGLRYVRPDGSLVFPKFAPKDFRQDVHATLYRCVATNSVGSVASRDVKVRAVVSQPFEVRAYDEFVTRGNAALFRCHLPSFAKDVLTITAWLRDDGLLIHSTLAEGSKYAVLPTGELLIRETDQQDGFRTYRCQTRHRLTGAVSQSVTVGQLILTEPHNMVPPRITHRLGQVTALEHTEAVLPCVAQGYPLPTYQWLRRRDGDASARPRPVPLDGARVSMSSGSLFIRSVMADDAGKYYCLVNNTARQDRAETELVVYAPLRASVSPSRVSASIGHTLRLNCSATGYPVRELSWSKDARPLYASDRVKLLFDDRVLVVNAVKRQDRGMYQCFVRNQFEVAQAASEVILNDEPPVLESVFSESIHKPGGSVSLRCTATGNPLPQVTWDLDGRHLPETIRYRVGDYVTRDNRVVSYVNISSVRPEDGGVYRCRAANDVGSVAHVARVNVYGPPAIRPMGNVTALSGGSLVVHCPVGGYPLTAIRWEREGRTLPSGHRQLVHANGTLVLSEVNRKADEGTYECVAENGRGDIARRPLHVHVMVGPKVDPFKFPSDLEEGMRTVVVCVVIDGDPPVFIGWLKDGRPLGPDLGAHTEMLNAFTSSLTFHSVGPQHSGNYTCVARNPAAAVNRSATMTVKVPPYWRKQPTDKAGILGESVIIDCQADGVPHPQIRWKKMIPGPLVESQTIISNPYIQILENGSLVLREIGLKDAGEYMCQATNNVKPSLSEVIKLRVHVPAFFKSQFSSQNVQKGEDVRIRCEAFGEKPINITWTKDRQVLNFQAEARYKETTTTLPEHVVSEIHVKSADRRDSSLFTCMASNAYGRDETNFQVVVQEKPDSPRNLNIKEVTSQSVTMSWMQPYSGNLPLTSYIVQYKRDSEQWTPDVMSVRNSPSDLSVVVRNLNPVTTYNFRVVAENALGHGNPSEVVSVITKEEAPSNPPTDIKIEPTSSKSIKIKWKAPPSQERRSPVKGYYLGYKLHRSGEQYVYKTLESSRNSDTEEFTLNNLRRNTEYSIRLQAFNSAGSGPASEEIVAKTLEHDPPSPPMIRVQSTTATSVHLLWEPPDIPVTGYILHYKEEQNDWVKQHVPGTQQSIVLENLRCGTRYQLYMEAFNDAGKGDPTQVLSVKTEGTAPVAPDKSSFLAINSTFVLLHLGAWYSGGCHISFFVAQYKPKGESEWTLISNHVQPQTETLMVPQLQPGTWYNLLMTAHNDAGSTDAEFVFATYTENGGTVPPLVSVNSEERRFYRHLGIVVPVACSAVIVLMVSLVLCLFYSRTCCRARSRVIYETAGEDDRSRNSKTGSRDMVDMVLLSKKLHSSFDETNAKSFYPSPPRLTQSQQQQQQAQQQCLSAAQSAGQLASAGQEFDDANSDCDSVPSNGGGDGQHRHHHTYDVPFHVRRPPGDEETYSKVKRVIPTPVPATNLYQVPQVCDTGRKTLERRRNGRLQQVRELGSHQQWVPSSQLISSTAQPSDYRRTRTSSRPPYNGTGSDAEHSPQRCINADDDDLHEVSEAECDRELNKLSFVKGDGGLRVLMPPVGSRETPYL
ncbi:cell adhesion molecule Dscam1-like isoform X1 [Dermacentor andersoni]|uniref:cell adhesion molecule Dscam1-like isoform X1 n=1 Tax=Dermacentor andersoni TaxID=34620 RepID=UPI002155C53D|nr:cell adhesion molecule Dscam2-like isoform X1 [Dermacentor andersoni]